MNTVTNNNITGQLRRHHALWAFMSIQKQISKYSIIPCLFLFAEVVPPTFGGEGVVWLKTKQSTIDKLFIHLNDIFFFKLLPSGIHAN